MKFIFKLNCILLFVLFSQVSSAQEVWDWQKSIEYALQNNIQVKQADLSIQLGEATLKQQRLNYSPNINAASNYDLRIGNNFNFFTSEYTRELVHYHDYSLNITQPVFDGLITSNNVKKSKLDLQALQFDEQVVKSDIQLQILKTFLDIMNANEQYQQAVNQKKITQQQYEHTKALIDAGAAAEKALVDIDVQLAGQDLTISQRKNELDLAYLSLKFILQLDPKRTFTVKIPELPKDLPIQNLEDPNQIFETALQLRPEIKSSRIKIESAKRAISIAKGAYYPTLNFVANANTFFSSQSKITSQVLTGNTTAVGFVEGTLQRVFIPETVTQQSKNPYTKQLNQNLNYALGLALNIPIYNKYQVQTAIKNTRLNYQVSILTEKLTEINLYNTIQKAYLTAQAAIEGYRAAQKNFEFSGKSYDYAVERLNAGSINQLEVNLAQSNLATSESKLTQAKYEYLFNTKVLDFYQGKKITLE
ncbi:MAG: transporter [Bacteroidota bacterium]|nr:transporter [Bacteroidota bacterium]